MTNFLCNLICLFLLFSCPVWASISNEEQEALQKKLLERAIKLEEARQEKMSLIAEAMEKSNFDEAIKLCSQIIQYHQLKGDAKADILVMRGLAFFRKGHLASAKEDADKAISENGKEVRAYLLRSNIHEKENRPDLASADMETYLRRKPGDREGEARLQKLKGLAATPKPEPAQPAAEADPAPALATGARTSITNQSRAGMATPVASASALTLFEAQNKSYALYIPTDWLVNEDAQPDSMRITTLAPDQSAAVDFLWARNKSGEINALLALAAYRQFLVPSGADVVWGKTYLSSDNSRATVTMQYKTPSLSLEGTFYLEASAKALTVQGYLAKEGLLVEQRPLLYNIMASLAFSKQSKAKLETYVPFTPNYISAPLVSRVAQDGSLTMKTPEDWGFVAAQSKVITSTADGGQGFAFLTFAGNPILRGKTVTQGVIAQPYMNPVKAMQVILAGFGHRNIVVNSHHQDPRASQEFLQQIGRQSDAQDMEVTWTSAKGVPCLGFFKIINAAPSPTGLWFCMLAGIWGPQNEFYRYYQLLEQVSTSFSINDQYARRYIQEGLKRARELHDKTVAMMRENANQREKQQADWEAKQKHKDFVESKWDDYRRGATYWVSDMENGKVYQTDSYGLKDKGTGDYYEGSGYSQTHFEGRSPVHPSETMREVSSGEVEQLMGR